MDKQTLKIKLKIIGILLLSVVCAILIILSLGAFSKHLKAIGYNIMGNIASLLIVLVTIVGVITFNRKFNKLKPKNYGLHFRGLGKSFLIGFGLVFLIILAVLISANQLFEIQVGWSGLYENFEKPLAMAIVVALMVAIWEEVFFRGLVFTTLFKNNFGFHGAAIISTLLFSLVHWSSFDMQTTSWFWYLGIAFIGYILVILYIKTNSIWTPIFFHFFWNFLVDFMEDGENEIGLYTIPNYDQYDKLIDNIEVFFLGIALIFIWKFEDRFPRSSQ
jgi:membrane protease YdiL (CAAX protease family)